MAVGNVLEVCNTKNQVLNYIIRRIEIRKKSEIGLNSVIAFEFDNCEYHLCVIGRTKAV